MNEKEESKVHLSQAQSEEQLKGVRKWRVDDGPLSVCFFPGLFVVGRFEKRGNFHPGMVDRLHNPRAFAFLDGGQRIQLTPLPGNPTVIELGNAVLVYPVSQEDVNLIELYRRVTSLIAVAEPSNVIQPEAFKTNPHRQEN